MVINIRRTKMHFYQIAVIFGLGMAQGFILTDWYRDKQTLKAAISLKKSK